ncbi:MAG: twitching motility protein PilT [Lachnospiraceae bacterium]|nr:twitching motility protein PilT [Lachnospiraceae bacterium]
MVQLIVGNKGKGKTKHLLDKVNSQVQEVSGNIVYLDKSAKHMYELNNKVRLIDLSQYGIGSSDGFVGFLYGIISQDHDLQQMYLDNFLTLAKLADDADITPIVEQLEGMGEKFGVDFILSVGQNEAELAAGLKDKVIVSL